MRTFVYLVAALSLFSCGQIETAGPVRKKESKYKRLLAKFKSKEFDTLHVYSPDDSAVEYRGVELDSIQITFLPRKIAQQHFNDPQGIFAVYKFPIDSNQLGLIARTPSDYESTSIKLFFFDQEKDTISSYVELAEFWGDAGDILVKDAWLYKEKGEKLSAFMRMHESHDNSVDSETDTTIEEKNYYYLLDLSGKKADTLSKDEKLGVQFGHLTRQRER